MAAPVGEGPGIIATTFLDESGQPMRRIEVNTYYKDALWFHDATPIRLSAGRGLTDLSLRLARTRGRHGSGPVLPPEFLNISPRLL